MTWLPIRNATQDRSRGGGLPQDLSRKHIDPLRDAVSSCFSDKLEPWHVQLKVEAESKILIPVTISVSTMKPGQGPEYPSRNASGTCNCRFSSVLSDVFPGHRNPLRHPRATR